MTSRAPLALALLALTAAAAPAPAARVDPVLASAVARGGSAPALVVLRPVAGSPRGRARVLKARKASLLRGLPRTDDFAALPIAGTRVDRKALARLARHPLVIAVETPRSGRIAQAPELPADGAPEQPERSPGTASEQESGPEPSFEDEGASAPDDAETWSGDESTPTDGAVVPGHTGRGAEVMVADTGADLRDPTFGSCPRPGAPGCRIVASLELAGRDGRSDDDPSRHGTHVAALIARSAPEVRIVVADVFRRTPFGLEWTTAALLKAVDTAVRRRDAGHDLAAINLSLVETGETDGDCSAGAIGAAIAAARRAGIVVVAAAGNGAQHAAAFRRGLAAPACHRDAVSVGALHDGVEEAGCDARVACFSQSGRGLDLLAPGVAVEAAGRRLSGTSQAAPLVTAAVAALSAAEPLADPEDVRAALLGAGEPVTDRRSGVTTRALDGGAALSDLRNRVGSTPDA